MCGLAGFTGYYKADPSKMRILLTENQSRGTDSTGIYGRKLMRKPIKAVELMKDVNFNHIANANVVIAHTRKSTGGALTKENSHPFIFSIGKSKDLLVGTHNGWVVNEYEAEQKIDGFIREEVDSASVFKAMAMTEDKLKFSMFEGAMALAFIWKGKLHLYRRENRPLFIGRAKEGYYYSSIHSALINIGIPENKTMEVLPDKLICFNGSKIESYEEVGPPRVKFGEFTYMSNWEYLVKDHKLMEELTGKKSKAPEQNTGAITKDQRKLISTNNTASVNGTTSRSTTEGSARLIKLSDIQKIGMPRIIGQNFILPLNDHEPTVPGMRKIISDLVKVVDTSIVDNTSNLQVSPLWISNPIYKVAAKSELYLMFKNLYKEEFAEVNKNIDGISISINPRAFRSTDTQPYMMTREGFSIIVETFDDEGAVHFIKPMKIEESFYFSEKDLKSGVKKGGSVDFKITITDELTPGFMYQTSVKLSYGCYYSMYALFNIDKFHEYKNSVVSNLTWTMPSRFDEKSTKQLYLDFRKDNPAKATCCVITPAMCRNRRSVLNDIQNVKKETVEDRFERWRNQEFDSSEYTISDPDYESNKKKDQSIGGSNTTTIETSMKQAACVNAELSKVRVILNCVLTSSISISRCESSIRTNCDLIKIADGNGRNSRRADRILEDLESLKEISSRLKIMSSMLEDISKNVLPF